MSGDTSLQKKGAGKPLLIQEGNYVKNIIWYWITSGIWWNLEKDYEIETATDLWAFCAQVKSKHATFYWLCRGKSSCML